MKSTLVAATGVAFLCIALVVRAQAPAQPPRSAAPAATGAAPAGVAVIDVTYILENYTRLKQQSEAFKRDVENAEAVLKKERESIAKGAEELKTKKPGSPDFKTLEEELVKRESDWKLKVARQKAEFAERESKTYLFAYREIEAAVKAYSERHGISLVLRFSGAPIDPNNREAVQMEVFKMVMYHRRDIDITDPILEQLNRTAAVATPPRGVGQPGAAQQQRR